MHVISAPHGRLILDWPHKSEPPTLPRNLSGLTSTWRRSRRRRRGGGSSSEIQVAQFQRRGKDLLCDNCSCLLATGVQVNVLRGWHMEARVCVCVCERGRACGRLSSQQCFKANIANGADWPAAWRAVQPPASLQSHHWPPAHLPLSLPLSSFYRRPLLSLRCRHAAIAFTVLSLN